MLRKLFLIGSLSFLVLLIVGGWFGYQAWQHASATLAVQARQADVVARWLLNPEEVKKAARGRGGVQVPDLDSMWRAAGAAESIRYSTSGTSMTVDYLVGACDNAKYTFDFKSVSGVTSVIVYGDASWLPDLPAFWKGVTGQSSCTASLVSRSIVIPFSTPITGSAVIDGVTGRSMRAQ